MWHLIQVNLVEFVLNPDSWAIFLHIRAIYWHSWAYLGNNFGPISYELKKSNEEEFCTLFLILFPLTEKIPERLVISDPAPFYLFF